MSENQLANNLKALIDLLDEPDNAVYDKIRDGIIALGPDAIPLLEETWENTFEGLVQKRIEEIIHVIQFDDLQMELNNWIEFNNHDLLKAFCLVSKFQYPELNEADLIKKIEQIRWDVWLELNDSLTPLEEIKVVNHVMFDIHRFSANKMNPNALQNHFLNNLLENQRGNALSLSVLYLIICQKLDLPVYGIDLPEHFVLAYTNRIREDNIVYKKDKKDVLFYINPAKKGTAFTRKEVDLFLTQISVAPDPVYYLPCSNVSIVIRLVNALITAYQQFKMEDKVRELEILLEILEK